MNHPLDQKSELYKRVVTAVIGVGLLLTLLFAGGYWGMALITFAISMGMLLEFSSLAFRLEDRSTKRGFMTMLGISVHFALMVFGADFGETAAIVFLVNFTFFLLTAYRHRNQERLNLHTKECIYAFFGFFYSVFLPSLLVQVRQFEDGVWWVAFFLLVIWAGDTGAYFAGRRFGRRKLYPLISPKKTIEGLVGGLTASVLAAAILGFSALSRYDLGTMVTLALFVSAVSVVGDLCESLIKRGFDVKDSGSILPGHGGFLDRFDSVVFGLPIMYAGLKWIFRA